MLPSLHLNVGIFHFARCHQPRKLRYLPLALIFPHRRRQDPPIQEPPQERQRPEQKELPTKKVPDKAKRSSGKIAALKVRRKA
jgi:hypothetical protein